MIGELGQFSLIAALSMALALMILPAAGAWRHDTVLMGVADRAAAGLLLFTLLAFVLLAAAFVNHDFSLLYVARQSNSLLPLGYRLSAVWGGHEGSLLLWVLIHAGWTMALVRFSGHLPAPFRARVLAVMGLIASGFLLFLLLTSNPFERLLPAAADGADLNPLLQDPGLIIHPPILYIGYVGFSAAFGFAVAALLEGRVDRAWVRWARPWTLTAWAFLTGGIALGSWWAYYELGWGGWWFWDPVENASFMPWLAGVALLHSQMVTEKRGAFINWTLLLSIIAFSLSLLGTFLVRSGVLTSVHAFASDPSRGIFILAFLGLVSGGALTLYALRAPHLEAGEGFAWLSRETLLMLNNVFFAAALGMVLLGTLYPLVADAFGLGKISVGPPYFGTLFTLLITPVVLLIVAGPYSRWRADRLSRLWPALRPVLITALAIGLIAAWLLAGDAPRAWFGMLGGLWLMLGTVAYLVRRWRAGGRFTGGVLGMGLAHFGVGVFVIGVSMVESGGIERDVRLAPGEQVEVAGYTFAFTAMTTVQGPNFEARQGHFTIRHGAREVAVLEPQKRRYTASGQVMTEAAIDWGVTRDLYLALGEALDDQGTWSVRIYYKPFIRWIWFGAIFILAGGFFAAADRRLRQPLAATAAPQPAPLPGGALPAAS